MYRLQSPPIHWSPPEPAHPHRNVPKRNWQFLVTPAFYFIAPEPQAYLSQPSRLGVTHPVSRLPVLL